MMRYTAAQLCTLAERIADIPAGSICAPTRCREVMRARQAVMYALRFERHQSFSEIGRRIGGRDHTTAMSAIRHAAKLRDSDPDFAALCDAICLLARSIYGGGPGDKALAALEIVAPMVHNGSGPKDACNVTPTLTDNDHGRIVMAPNPNAQNAPACQAKMVAV